MTRHKEEADLPVISLFSGALGLDLGLEQAGFRTAVAVECNHYAAETIRKNRPEIKVIEKRIEQVSTDEILEAAGLRRGQVAAVTGGPSCQPFSTVGRRGSVNDPRGVMFREFLRVVREAQPRFFVMENVRGVLSAAVKHRPLAKRGPGFAALTPQERLGSAFGLILKELQKLEYYVVFDLLNAADYGTPQVRQRVVFIGSRDGKSVEIPRPTHAAVPAKKRKAWVTLGDALEDLDDAKPVFKTLSASKARYMKLVPEGGNWRDLPRRMQRAALGGAYISWGGRVGFFRRLAWDRPAPALTTRPDSKATMACHPEELRSLSIREYARVQQFPDSWGFSGPPAQQYLQVGNAVPVGLGKAVGNAIVKSLLECSARARKGICYCPNETLVVRLTHRRKTVLNPTRMRTNKGLKAARKWMSKLKGGRDSLLRALKMNGQSPKTGKTQVPRAARRSR